MSPSNPYKRTKTACYLAYVSQAAVITLMPLLFTTLREQLGVSYTVLALLTGFNFVTQLSADFFFSSAAAKFGYKPFVLLSMACECAGFTLLALAGSKFSSPVVWLFIATFLFALGGGLSEILISPIINGVPSDSSAGSMAILHSMYSWGQMSVVLITTLLLYILGAKNWPVIVMLWALLPIVCAILFLGAKYPENAVNRSDSTKLQIMKSPIYALCAITIFFGAGAEHTIVGWSSAFMEEVLSIPKVYGDIAGILMFAFGMAIGRFAHGLLGNRVSLSKSMLIGSMGVFLCMLTMGLSPYPVLSFIACALSGICVALLWPGTLVLASESFPKSGAWLFAFMAVSGDLGAAACPFVTGKLADMAGEISFLADIANRFSLSSEQTGMRTGFVFSSIYGLVCAAALIMFRAKTKKKI